MTALELVEQTIRAAYHDRVSARAHRDEYRRGIPELHHVALLFDGIEMTQKSTLQRLFDIRRELQR